ncbi:hypothetical protein [Staphylococcus saprophyticus]|uniref:hypothetical protein n=1 Tax=Staphylococcus saprophyticus TaxID=29385 RepID=UPI0008528D07|nr:hypothetical protein [Staphylococcus saprophyticus]MDW4192841.1 hypothetical protein [Staphylococcus saprophyticus]MDW4263771.1 hypothetical protein [Staphylococcus saprophyticus]MDW4308760.1 hypothetical protein [Staphylococcus saprophyticus]MDW4378022.1 hypothetical protein [Staphylococcus saprophyticus]MDW4396901.1 hypothetical protein [Staphylococcus saprophyticus]
MNELEQLKFDYSLVDNKTAEKLKTYDKQLNRIYNSYSIEVGEVLYNAHEELSNYGDGTFIKWAESKGIKKASVYNYINAYKFVQQLDKPEEKETFLTQPKRLQYAMSKPSANKEVNQAVLDGEVKSSKEYKELEKQLKQRDEEKSQLESQLEQAQRSESIARKQLEEAEDKEPEVVERYMEPDDYQELKDNNQQLQDYLNEVSNHNKKLNSDIEKLKSERSETDEKSQKYDELNKAINNMNTKLNEGQQRLKAQKEIYDLVKGSEKVIREVAPLCYLAFSKDIIDNDYARKPIEKIINDLSDMASRLQKQINQGDVIDV